jgi:NADH-quinone oxidoreductase subunit G
VLNARIRKAWRANDIKIGVIGEMGDLRYDYEQLGAGPETLKELADGKHKFFKHAEIGQEADGHRRAGRSGARRRRGRPRPCRQGGRRGRRGQGDWNGFAVLHTAAARVGGLDLGFVPGEGGKDAAKMVADTDVLFLLGADELDLRKRKEGGFTVYIGTHGDVGAHHADVILPASAYTEKSATYVNTEGRVQMTTRAGFAPGDAKEDWAILRALSDVLGHKLPFDSLAQLRAKLYEAHPHFARIEAIEPGNAGDIAALAKKGGRLAKSAFASPVKDFYLTNPIARASAVMAECSSLARNGFAQAAE